MRAFITAMIATVGIMLTSCGEPRFERAHRLAMDRLAIERLRLEADCRNMLLEQAISEVDSIIIERALRDTSARLLRPTRPDVPNLEIPDIDTLGIKPLFEKEG